MKNIIIVLFILSSLQFSFSQIIVDDSRTAQNLVEDVLLSNNTGCATVSNFTVSGGNSFGLGSNSFGYFNSNGSIFPFAEGIILSSGSVNDIPGPNNSEISSGDSSWPGFDATTATLLNEPNTSNATSLEFDFVPSVGFMSFEYIFASEEYVSAYMCTYSDVFGFLIKEASQPDSAYINIALVPNTTTPVKVTTVHPDNMPECPAINEQYFGSFNGTTYPTQFDGQTVALTVQSAVTPGVTYHIKLTIADDGDQALDSAVFLRGGSFNIGTFLGDDHLFATNTVLCADEDLLLDAGTANSYQWFKDGVALTGETSQSYTVTPTLGNGNYSVNVDLGGGCTSTGDIDIEYDALPIITDVTYTICRIDATDIAIYNLLDSNLINDITINDATLIVQNFFLSLTDAQNNTSEITAPNAFQNTSSNQIIYVRVANTSGCVSIAEITLSLFDNPEINADENTDYCTNTFPIPIPISSGYINGITTDYTYNWSTGETSETININTLGDYTITITDANGCSNSRIITVIEGVVFENDEPNFIDSDAVYCNNIFPDTTTLTSAIENNDLTNYNYLWSTGETTPEIEINTAGIYTLTVTSLFGCTETRAITVTNYDFFENPEPTFVFDETSIYCEDTYPETTDLIIEFENNDITTYTFQWFLNGADLNENTTSISLNLTGEYTVLMTNPQGCTEIKTFHVNGSSVFSSTEPNFIDSEVIYCLNTFPNTITLDVNIENNDRNLYDYDWYKDDVLIVGDENYTTHNFAPTINVNLTPTNPTLPIVYKVNVSNVNGCIVTRSITVKPSEPTTIEDVLITDTNHKNRLNITVINSLSHGDYQYGIDINPFDLDNEDNYQDSNIFNDILYGTHIVYVRDINGCGVVQKEVLFLDYPKFITPNNDGKYDTWNIDNINRTSSDFNTISNIIIFDRMGKIIAVINPKGLGWDGNYKGEEAPAADYWFSVELIDGNGNTFTKKGHFSLKRFM